MILSGPVLWLMGILAFWAADRNPWIRLATIAMTMSATGWAITFVFDGFVAPYIVRWLPAEAARNILSANQVVVIRLGLISWIVLGFSLIVGGIGMIALRPTRGARIFSYVGI